MFTEATSELRILLTLQYLEDLEGMGERDDRRAVVIHFMHFKPFLKNKKEEV